MLDLNLSQRRSLGNEVDWVGGRSWRGTLVLETEEVGHDGGRTKATKGGWAQNMYGRQGRRQQAAADLMERRQTTAQVQAQA